jgi:hypothetical protein
VELLVLLVQELLVLLVRKVLTEQVEHKVLQV